MIRIGMCPDPFLKTAWSTQANPHIYWLAEEIKKDGGEIIPISAKQVRNPDKLGDLHLDVLHLHWPAAAFNYYVRRWQVQKILPKKLVEVWARIQLSGWEKAMQKAGIPMVWEVHDLLSHHAVGYNYVPDVLLHQAFFRQSAGLILHGDHCYPPIREFFNGDKPYTSAVLGSFRPLYGPPISREEARSKLGIQCRGRIFSYLGSARPLRTPVKAAQAFIANAGEDDLLIIAGKNLDRYISEDLDNRIKVFHGMLPSDLFHQILCASDFVINDAPRYLTSAIIRVAMSYGRPVIAYPFGSAPDMAEGAAIWLDDSPDTLVRAIQMARAMDVAAWQKMSDAALKHENELTWESAGRACIALYEQVCAK